MPRTAVTPAPEHRQSAGVRAQREDLAPAPRRPVRLRREAVRVRAPRIRVRERLDVDEQDAEDGHAPQEVQRRDALGRLGRPCYSFHSAAILQLAPRMLRQLRVAQWQLSTIIAKMLDIIHVISTPIFMKFTYYIYPTPLVMSLLR